MPITYTIDREKKLILETWTGEVSASDLAEYWKRYLGDTEVLPLRRTVVDMREAVIRFTGWEMDRLIKDIVLPALEGRDWKTAIVVKEPTQFGVSRQYQVFAQRYSKDSIFSTVEEARTWLAR